MTTEIRDAWYPIARSRDVGDKPIARKLLGRPLVVFRDRARVVRALDAVCPHRGANLAHGEVVDGCIRCPYHGWRFDGDGRCTKIPGIATIPEKFAVARWQACEQQGLIWITIGEPAEAHPPRFDVLDDKNLDGFCYELVAPVPFDWWVENALDTAHLPYVHPRTIGDGKHEDVLGVFQIERHADQRGFTGRWKHEGKYSLVERLLELDMSMDVIHRMPGNTLFDIDLGKGRRQIVLALATPEDANTTRTWNFASRNFLRLPFANAIGWLFLRRVLAEDIATAAKSIELMTVQRPVVRSTALDALGLEYLRLAKLWNARGAEIRRSR